MNYLGVLHGFIAFLLIGLFHPIVIKAEYYYGRSSIAAFVVVGILSFTASLMIENITASTTLGVFAFCCFWSIKEVLEQEQRVLQGRFPKNPNWVYKGDKQ